MRRQKKRFVVIGLGHFGAYAARTLYELGKEVIAIDVDAEKVQDAAEYTSQAVVANATEREALEALGVADADAAIISLGERMDVITLAALHVKEMGVPFVAVKALSEEHGRILSALGINDIIHPEKEGAIRLANRLARADVVDFLPLLPGYSIAEIKAPPEFIGKNLRELAIRTNLNVQLIAIQSGKEDREKINIVPRADDVIKEGDLLILLGEDRDVDRVRDIVNNPPKQR
jgi:trk system potassium uptake protein TrkA